MEFAELKNFQNEEDAMDDIGATESGVVGLDGRTARLEGIVEQIAKRLTNLEQGQREIVSWLRWLAGIMFTSWLTIVGLILFKLGN